MIKNSLEKELNDQINAEFYSAYLYLSMAAYFDTISLRGFSNWMNVQYQEEMSHMLKMYNFVLERGGKVMLTAIDAPPSEWSGPLEVFEETLRHEEMVTERINNIVDLAIREKDHATNNFLQWFVSEQVEEESNVSTILEQTRMLSDSKESLYMLDKELSQRVFVDATKGAGA